MQDESRINENKEIDKLIKFFMMIFLVQGITSIKLIPKIHELSITINEEISYNQRK